MSLPIRTTPDDIKAVCNYLATKPTGATLAEARAVVDKKRLDGRKLNALKFWGLVQDDGPKMKITELGRRAVKDHSAFVSEVLREVVREVPPYFSVIERIVHRQEETISVTEVAAHWHENFKSDVSDSEKILNDQAVCFFQVAQGADLGVLIIGRKGSQTRFDFYEQSATALVSPQLASEQSDPVEKEPARIKDIATTAGPEKGDSLDTYGAEQTDEESKNRIFITHGENGKILEQVKQLVTYGKFEPVVAMEHETSAKPVPKKVMDDMRTCGGAVIHVGAEGILLDPSGNEVPQVNGNVLIEIGAAMALYGDRFVLLVEEGVSLPSNLQGLYECRYQGEELNMEATMKLLQALSEF